MSDENKNPIAEDSAERNRFALHVQLIKLQDGVSTTEAKFRAWLEGPASFKKRLAAQA